jgi:hypothetical protein
MRLRRGIGEGQAEPPNSADGVCRFLWESPLASHPLNSRRQFLWEPRAANPNWSSDHDAWKALALKESFGARIREVLLRIDEHYGGSAILRVFHGIHRNCDVLVSLNPRQHC